MQPKICKLLYLHTFDVILIRWINVCKSAKTSLWIIVNHYEPIDNRFTSNRTSHTINITENLEWLSDQISFYFNCENVSSMFRKKFHTFVVTVLKPYQFINFLWLSDVLHFCCIVLVIISPTNFRHWIRLHNYYIDIRLIKKTLFTWYINWKIFHQ